METEEDIIINESIVSIYILKNLQASVDEGFIMIADNVCVVLFDYEQYLVKIFSLSHDDCTRIIQETLTSAGLNTWVLNYRTTQISTIVKDKSEPPLVILNKIRMEAHHSKMDAVIHRNYEMAGKYRDIEVSILRVIDNITKEVI